MNNLLTIYIAGVCFCIAFEVWTGHEPYKSLGVAAVISLFWPLLVVGMLILGVLQFLESRLPKL